MFPLLEGFKTIEINENNVILDFIFNNFFEVHYITNN